MFPKKISFFIPTLEAGGVEVVTVNLINELDSKGYEIDLLVINSQGPIRKRVNPGINIIDFDKKRILHAIPKLVKYYRYEKPKVLFTALSHVNFISIISKKIALSKVKIITSTRNLDSANPKKIIPKKIQEYTLKHSYKHIAITEVVKKLIINNTNLVLKNIYVINNPILMSSKSNYRKKKKKEEKKRILTVGRLEPIKNQLILIKAIGEVIKKDENISLTIVGDGSLKEELMSAVKRMNLENYVYFAGYKNIITDYYEEADLFVLPSYKEGLGNVVVEAMSYSLPIIIAQNSGGPVEILKEYYNNEDNFYVQNSIDDLAKKIIKNLSLKNNQVKSYDLNKYTISEVSQKYLELINEF